MSKPPTIIYLSAVFLAFFSLVFALLKPGIPSGHDISAHIIRSRLFINTLHEGQFPVRWTNWVSNGFDQPLFNFFPVGFYYLVSFIDTFIPFLTQSLKVTIVLLWWLGSLFMFLYARRFGNLAGGLSALLYAFTPYLISDIYVRAAYPEMMAITFATGSLWALDRLLTSARSIYGLPLAFFLAGLLISHLPSVVIILPILIGYSLLLTINQEVKLKSVVLLGASLALGLGLSAFYLLPSLFELNLIKSSLLTSEYYDFRPHFVYPQQLFSTFWGYGISQAGPDDGMSFQLGIIQWIIIFTTILVLFFKKLSNRIRTFKIYLIFWLLVILYAVFFMHDVSLAFWENIKAISFIQYPWRFLMVVVLAVPCLSAILLRIFPKSWQKAGIIIITILAVFIFYRNYLQPATFLPENYFNSQKAYLEEGYLPKEVEQLPTKDINKWEILKGKAKVEEKIIKAFKYQFVISSSEQLVFQLNSHFFPGWKVYIDNLEVKEDHTSPYGFMVISVPAGLHQVEAKFTNTPIRSFANAVSVISLIILVIWQFFPKKGVDNF